jgi:hypothetical protein
LSYNTSIVSQILVIVKFTFASLLNLAPYRENPFASLLHMYSGCSPFEV